MAEVATRTSKGGVLGDAEKNASSAFDLRSWQGLTALLKASRESKMDQETYAAFRDMVLAYAGQGGSDPELRKKIESVIRGAGVQVPVMKQSVIEERRVPVAHAEERPVAKISQNGPSFKGASRSVPRFAVRVSPEIERMAVPEKKSNRSR